MLLSMVFQYDFTCRTVVMVWYFLLLISAVIYAKFIEKYCHLISWVKLFNSYRKLTEIKEINNKKMDVYLSDIDRYFLGGVLTPV